MTGEGRRAGPLQADARAARRREHYVSRTRGGEPRKRVAAALDYLRQEMPHHPRSQRRVAELAVAFLVDLTDRLQRGEIVDNH